MDKYAKMIEVQDRRHNSGEIISWVEMEVAAFTKVRTSDIPNGIYWLVSILDGLLSPFSPQKVVSLVDTTMKFQNTNLELATKIDKIFIIDLTLCSKCQTNGEDFVNFCGLLRKHELYPCSVIHVSFDFKINLGLNESSTWFENWVDFFFTNRHGKKDNF